MIKVSMSANPDKPLDDGSVETGIITKTRPKTKKPSMYKVLLLNDDYTPVSYTHLRAHET